MNKKSLRLAFCMLFLVVICVIGIFSLSSCGAECAEHDFEIIPVTATCEQGGLVTRFCKNCNYHDEIESEALGHSFNDWGTDFEATCQSAGQKCRNCERCGFAETEEIEILPHTTEAWTIQLEPTKDKKGMAYSNCKVCNDRCDIELPVINETDYAVTVVDSESKIYTYTTGNSKIEIFVSNFRFYTVLENNTVVGYQIYGSNISADKLVIPSTHMGLPVISIPAGAFRDEAFSEVVIPEGVKYIGQGAFQDCENLKKITMPSTVVELGKGDYGYTGSAFSGIENLYYNGTVETWCKIKFLGSIHAENISFINENNEYTPVTEITIPTSITAIGDYQFYGFSSLTTVNMHGGITSIGTCTFEGSGLVSFTMPDSVTSVGASAFFSCDSLTAIKLSENLEVIDNYTFGSCSNLESITIPSKVKYIKYYAFNGCENLAEVNVKEDSQLQEIGEGAFREANFTSIVIPASVRKVGRDAFNYPLATIYYMGKENSFSTITGKNYLNISDSTVWYYSENIPTNSASTLWHFDENGDITFWTFGNTVAGKTYVYSYSETTVTEEYWMMLKQLEQMEMLEYWFDPEVLGPEIAQQQINMYLTSSNKAEYEAKLSEFSAATGQNSSYTFGTDGKVTVSVQGQIQLTADYVEVDNVIYVNKTPVCYLDAQNNRIYENNVTEYTSVWHYFELVTD